MGKIKGHNAEIILVTKQGSLILQQRDDKPGITNPGMITTFGGKVEDGETPEEAAQRELSEETNLDLPLDRFIHWGVYEKNLQEHGEDWDVDYFVVKDISTDGLEVYEGQDYVEVSSLTEVAKLNTSILFQTVARDWFGGWRDFLLLPDPPETVLKDLKNQYFLQTIQNHKPAVGNKIALCPTGLVASGKSTVCDSLAKEIDAVKVSSDILRERLYRKGYNFKNVIRPLAIELIMKITDKNYNIYIDMNNATGTVVLKQLQLKDYRVLIVHTDPPEEYIINKINTGKMKNELTFFHDNSQVLRSFHQNKSAHYKAFQTLKNNFDIWATVDTSKYTSKQEAELLNRLRKAV